MQTYFFKNIKVLFKTNFFANFSISKFHNTINARLLCWHFCFCYIHLGTLNLPVCVCVCRAACV